MIVLELRFPAGRYHATPWGRHVNEGAVEWPPSPWRIIRALIATWYLKARRSGEIKEATMQSLVHALSRLPVFRLPQATASHTRHYMPFNEGKNEKTTKIFDTFIQISDRDSVLVAWDVVLPEEELSALKILADRLGYFGRAESLVEARVIDGIATIESNAEPVDDGSAAPIGKEVVRLLAPTTDLDYSAWSEAMVAKVETGLGPRPTAAQKKKLPKIPPDLFSALQADTAEIQAAGWNLPPGAMFVSYGRNDNAFAPASNPLNAKNRLCSTVARYAVVSKVAPSIRQAISVADRVHVTLCSFAGDKRAMVFTGLDASGKPLTDHQHTHIFCEANGARDEITHITIWATMGFDEEARLALRKLNRVFGKGGFDIRLVLHGIGKPEDFHDCVLFGRSRQWRSITPFVSTRHAKTYRDGRPKMAANGWQEGSHGHDLLRLLALQANGKSVAAVTQLDEHEALYEFGTRRLRSLQFQMHRHRGDGRRGNQSGAGFIITFPDPQQGPFALGYGAHFGLGLFAPVPEVDI